MVGGYRPSDSGRGMASLILGTYENGKLIYRGRVGTGFTQAMRETSSRSSRRGVSTNRPSRPSHETSRAVPGG